MSLRPRRPRLGLVAFLCLSVLTGAGVVSSSCAADAAAEAAAEAGTPPNTLSESERKAGWQLLFNGDDLDQWRGYNAAEVPKNWSVVEGTIHYDGLSPEQKKLKGKQRPPRGDLMTRQKFDQFELSLEYRISEGGNSGIMFHVAEQEGKPPWHSGPEIQVQDNEGGHDPQKAGWLYQLFQPPKSIPIAKKPLPGQEEDAPLDATRPAGEWNQVTLKLSANQGEVNVNGVRYYTFVLGSDDWKKRVAESKFGSIEGFGAAGIGHIVLQDHGDAVSYRNIKIRDLSQPVADPVDGDLSTIRPEVAFPELKWDGWEPYNEKGKLVEFIPVLITGSGDGSGRLFVADQKGVIYAFDERPDVQSSTTFLDINEKVAHRGRLGDEEGLLGLAFHPQFARNGKFYCYYTLREPAHTSVISEFTVKAENAAKPSIGSADVASERELLRIDQPFPNHNGGTVCFDGEGYLCIAIGDGGAFYDPYNNAQDLTTPFGTVLRIDVNEQTEDKAYGIPAGNPFADGVGPDGGEAMPEIFAYGFRNPWRLTLDAPTGQLWLADVGQNLYEEINLVHAGGNYGWNYREGLHPFGSRVPPRTAAMVDPIWEYDHEIGKSITGGAVYRGQSAPDLEGLYVYADYVTGKLFALEFDGDSQVATANYAIPSDRMPVVTFGIGDSGEVYFGRATGNGKGVYKLVQADEAAE